MILTLMMMMVVVGRVLYRCRIPRAVYRPGGGRRAIFEKGCRGNIHLSVVLRSGGFRGCCGVPWRCGRLWSHQVSSLGLGVEVTGLPVADRLLLALDGVVLEPLPPAQWRLVP